MNALKKFLPIVIPLLLVVWAHSPVYAGTRTEPLIIDHTAVSEFDQLNDDWIQKAKELVVHYAHTSHGSQIISGLNGLSSYDPKYSVAVTYAGDTLPTSLHGTANDLRIYDGNPPETYISGGDYWSGDGITRTQAVADTNLFDYSMWSWCGEQSSNSEPTLTGDTGYLTQMNAFDVANPNMNFILITGHTDGTQDNAVSTLKRNNQIVREYALANNKIVFDFADIESYDPAGNYHVNTTDACSWCADWCTAHPEDCMGMPSSCSHSHPLNCKMKAQAYWVMMAKLAGWDPSESASSNPTSSFRLSPVQQTFQLGEDLGVEVILESNGNAVSGADLILHFDPAMLEVVAITNGTIFPSYAWSQYDNNLGTITISGNANFGQSYTGNSTFALITFRAKRAGVTDLVFDYTEGSTTDSNIVSALTGEELLMLSPVNGTYTLAYNPTLRFVYNLPSRLASVGNGAVVTLRVLDNTFEATANVDITGQYNGLSMSALSFGQSYDFLLSIPGFLDKRATQPLTVSGGVNPANGYLDFGDLLAGDINDDNSVNSFDLALLYQSWRQEGTGDFNGDGTVNNFDVWIMFSNYLEEGDN